MKASNSPLAQSKACQVLQMKTIALVFLVPLLLMPPLVGQEVERVRIGVIVDGPWERFEAIRQDFFDAIYELIGDEFQVEFPPQFMVNAEWSYATIEEELQRLVDDPQVDIILGFGPFSSMAVGRLESFPKPMIAPFIIDPELQAIPYRVIQGPRGPYKISGVTNLTYVEMGTDTDYEISRYRQIVPFDHLTFISDKQLTAVFPEIRVRIAERLSTVPDLAVQFIDASDSVDEVLEQLHEITDAVYVTPLLQLHAEEYQKLIDGFIEKRLPSMSMWGRADVEAGMLIALKAETDYDRLTRRVALNLQRILLGEDAGTLPVDFQSRENLTINMRTARAIGFYPSYESMTEAEILHPLRRQVSRQMTLVSAAREALDANLDLKVARQEVLAGAEEIRLAASERLPQVDASLSGLWIDRDRAAASFGSQPERSLTGSVGFSQVLFSDAVNANVTIQRRFQTAREERESAIRLDIIGETASVYFDVLRAKTVEAIARQNLELSRSNLDLAKVRVDVGFASPAEVYRWESQIANDKQTVIDANTRRNLVEISLNRLLRRPLEESFELEEFGLEDPRLVSGNRKMRRYMDNQWSFRVFRQFMAEQALTNSPELKELDANIEAQERRLLAARRSFWSPTLALQANLDQFLVKGGAGSESAPDVPGIVIPNVDNTLWNVGFLLTLPLYTGNARDANRVQAEEEIRLLRLQRSSVADRIEERLRSALHNAGAAMAGIRTSRESADASRKNLDLVIDSYRQGVVTILDLLDAQNQALTSELEAANAVYNFILDLIEVERSYGRFYFLSSQAEKDDWERQADQFFSDAGLDVGDDP